MQSRESVTVSRPGDHEEEADVEDLVVGELLPVELGLHDPAEQVRACRLGASLVDHGLEVLVDVLGSLLPNRLLLLHGVAGGPDDAVLHRQELVEILERQTHETQEHRAGHRDGELRVEVAASLACELVDELVEELGHLVVERCHRTRSEERVEDPPVLHVLRRVDLQRDERPDVAELDRFGPRREDRRGPRRADSMCSRRVTIVNISPILRTGCSRIVFASARGSSEAARSKKLVVGFTHLECVPDRPVDCHRATPSRSGGSAVPTKRDTIASIEASDPADQISVS